jgi:hypothetical protein
MDVHPIVRLASRISDEPTIEEVDQLLTLLYKEQPSSRRDELSEELFDLRAALAKKTAP